MTTTKINCNREFRRVSPDQKPNISSARISPHAIAFIVFWSILFAVMMGTIAQAFSLGEWMEQGKRAIEDTVDRIDKSIDNEHDQQPKPIVDSRPSYTRVQIREVQRILTRLGYKPGPIDGVFGNTTAMAIRSYQVNYGLPQTGQPTDQLLAHMTDTQNSKLAARPRAPGQTGLEQTERQTSSSGGGMVLPAPGGAPISSAAYSGGDGNAAHPSMAATAVPLQTGSGSHGAVAAARALGLKVIHGIPVIAGEEHYVLTKEQIAAAYKFTGLVELGLDADLLQSKPACFARAYLPTDAWDSYLDTGGEASKTPGYIMYTPMVLGNSELINWKGTNEFEKKRSRQAFLTDHSAGLKARAIPLPTDVLIINEVMLRQYDGKAGGFDIGFKGRNAGNTRLDVLLANSGVQMPRGTCTDYSKDRFLDFPPAVALPEIWAMDPSQAEKVLDRLVERRIFVAFTLRIWEIPLMKMDHNYLKLSQASKRIPVWSELTSVAIYEDAGLERLIETLPMKKAEEPVLLSGIPKSPRFPDTQAIDGATLALAMLRDHGDVLSKEAWHDLMVHQAALDKDYYDRRHDRYSSGGSIFKETTADYTSNHTPFFPNGFDTSGGFTFSSAQKEKFKKWATLRAEHLPDELILRVKIKKQAGKSVALDLPIVKSRDRTGIVEVLVSQGYSIGQILLPDQDPVGVGVHFDTGYLSGPAKQRKPALILPNISTHYRPSISNQDIRQIFEGNTGPWDSRLAEIHLRPGASKNVSVNGQTEVFALQVTPTRLVTYNQDGTTVLFERSYKVATLDPKRLDAGVLKISPPSGEALPLSAETMDLLTVKYLPNSVSDEDFRQMMVARWEYEAAVPPERGEPDWGRFFVPGKPKPDATKFGALAARFKEWTVKRAAALPKKLRLASGSFRLEAGKPVPVFTYGIYDIGMDPNTANMVLNTCKTEKYSHPAVTPACDYLATIRDTTPAIFPLGLGDKVAGPRMTCGSTLATGQRRDIYCNSRVGQFDKVRPSGVEPGFRDVLVYDKELFFPGSQSEALSLRSPDLVVDVVISGARVAKAPLPEPFMEALKRYDTFREGLGLGKAGFVGGNKQAPAVDYLVFDAQVQSARLLEVKTRKPIRDLELRAARTPDIEALALKDISTGAPDAPYGPDTVGVRLGMAFEEAEKAIRSQIKVGRVLVRDRARQSGAATGNFQKFSSAKIYVAADESEFIILYDEPPAAKNKVVAITREMHFRPGKMTATSALVQVRKKYGKEDWAGRQGEIGWGKGLQFTNYNDSISHTCMPGIGNIISSEWTETDGSQTKWQPASGYAIPVITLYNNPNGRNCGPILSMKYEGVQNSHRAEDRLVIQVIDPNLYMRLYAESKRLVQSGEEMIGNIPTAPDLKL